MGSKFIFPKIRGKVLVNEPLSKHTTFHIGGPCKVWAEPSNELELKEILRFTKSRKMKIFVVGMGSNILFKDNGFKGIVIHLGSQCFKNIKFNGKRVRVGAGVTLGKLINLASRRGLGGAEGLIGIPGTIGGAIFMNAGYKKDISDLLECIKVIDKKDAKIRTMKRRNIKFRYRQSNLDRYIILEATLKLRKEDRCILAKRKKSLLEIKKREQPLFSFNAGSVFKNPGKRMKAAIYIDMLGLKGKRIGDAKISEKHANFIINLKNAKAKDVLQLISLIKKRVRSHFGVELVPEIIIV